MSRARKTLYYPATYLTLTGLGLFFFPQQFLHLAFSTGHYENAFVQATGIMMLALAVVPIEILRHRIETLYPATLMLRAVVVLGNIILFFETRDPFFWVPVAVVVPGMIATTIAYLRDRKEAASLPASL